MVRMTSQSTVNKIYMRLRKKDVVRLVTSWRPAAGAHDSISPSRRHVIMSSCHHAVKDSLILKADISTKQTIALRSVSIIL